MTDTRQTDGLMQASDELRCSGMTIGAFSFSDDGGSERPRRRTTVPDSCRETAGTVAPQAAEEGEHGTFTRFSYDRMIRKNRPKPEHRSTEHPLNVGVAPLHEFKACALVRAPFTTNPAHLSARTPLRDDRWGRRCARGGESLGAP